MVTRKVTERTDIVRQKLKKIKKMCHMTYVLIHSRKIFPPQTLSVSDNPSSTRLVLSRVVVQSLQVFCVPKGRNMVKTL